MPESTTTPFTTIKTSRNNMYYIKKTIEVAACHRLELSYPSKCTNLHGHNWIITIYCKNRELNADGMVCDFTHVKEMIHGKLDHANLNEVLSFNPTAENMAKWICDNVPHCYKVEV